MNYKLWILIIAWTGIIFILILGHLGFDFISVVSNSMKHENEESFVQFWEERGCDITCIKKLPISGGFQGGDLLISKKTSNYKVGDILAYKTNCLCEDEKEEKCKCSDIIIHRLIDLNSTDAVLAGDNIKETIKNNMSEETVKRKFIAGKIIFKTPKLGLIKALLNCWKRGGNSFDCIINGNCG